MAVKYCVEAWTFWHEEDPAPEEMDDAAEFEDKEAAMAWAWERMEEGFSTRLHRR